MACRKIGLIVLLAIVLYAPAFKARAVPYEPDVEFCSQVSSVAENVMIHRQTVGDKQRTMRLALEQLEAGDKSDDPQWPILMGRIIDTAYQIDHEADRRKAAESVMLFKVTWTSMCINRKLKWQR